MANKEFLYAVAVVRANELSLLSAQDIEQIISAPDYKRAVALLCDKGYDEPQGSDYSAMLDSELEKTWELLKTNAPEAEGLNVFVVKNDYQNLKACLKAEVAGTDAAGHLVKPCIIGHEVLLECVRERKFDGLPDFISADAKKAFDTLTKTGNGQSCDIVIDTATLRAIRRFADKADDALVTEYADTFCLAADIKTAVRCARTKKSESFIETALAENPYIDTGALAQAALEGEDAILELLSESDLKDYRTALENGASAFEKYCDDRLISIVKRAKYQAMGIGPLAAYYVAKETEIKALRIILSAKISGASNDTVRERMRELYV